MKSKKLVPDRRFSEFFDDGEWEEVELELLSLKISDGIHSTPVYDDSGDYYFINGNNLIDGIIVIDEKTKRVSKEEYEKHKRVLNQHTILLSINGTIGNISTYNHEKVVLGKSACYININDKKANQKFIINFLKTSKVNNFFTSELTGSTIKNLSLKTVKNTIIDLPSLNEQQKIADCLSSVDNLITAGSKKVETLKKHKKALMQQLFPQDGEEVPKLRFPEFKNAPEWEEKTLKELAENLDNKRVPITSNVRSRGNIPYYGASGIVDFVNDYIFDEELLCISEDGANLVARTYPIAFSISGKTWVNNHAHVLKFENKYTQIIVENYLNSIKLDDFLTGMAQPKLNKAMLDIIPIPISSEPKEQQKIANFLSSIDELITSSTKKVETLKEHKKALMQQLFPSKEVQQ